MFLFMFISASVFTIFNLLSFVHPFICHVTLSSNLFSVYVLVSHKRRCVDLSLSLSLLYSFHSFDHPGVWLFFVIFRL